LFINKCKLFLFHPLQPPAFGRSTEQFTAKLEAMKSTMQQLKGHETFSSLVLSGIGNADRRSVDGLAESTDAGELPVIAEDNKQKDLVGSSSENGVKKLTNVFDGPIDINAIELICSPTSSIDETDRSKDFNSNELCKLDIEDPSRFATPDLPSGGASVVTSSDDDDELSSDVNDAVPNSEVKTELHLTVDETGAGDCVPLQMRSSSGWAGWPKQRDGESMDTPREPDDELVNSNGEGCLDSECRVL
jgi:hypothetical protein